MFDPILEAGKVVWFHSDGWTLEILEDLIELGVGVLNPQHHCMGNERVAQIIAGRVCLRSDLDRQYIIPFGTQEQIVEHVKEIIRLFGTSPRRDRAGRAVREHRVHVRGIRRVWDVSAEVA